jgi:hypothetical protein
MGADASNHRNSGGEPTFLSFMERCPVTLCRA